MIGSPHSASDYEQRRERETAFLVGVDGLTPDGRWPAIASVEELVRLVDTAGAAICGKHLVRIREPNPSTLIGTGQLETTINLAREAMADVLVIDTELLPRQQRNLEAAFRGKVLDRTAVILDIFASRAHTAEGRLQVERAQLEYLLPRLSDLWVEFSRQRGGIGPFRGPGETQIETDRRIYRDRIRDIENRLGRVRQQRGGRRRRRRDAGLEVAALVGYTNAGKSSLLNTLAASTVRTEDKLFATLDPTTRRVALKGGGSILLTDTVGFIQRLPPRLVDAFRATLEEIIEAQILIHVVDAATSDMPLQVHVVEQALATMGIGNRPVITVLNKADLAPKIDMATFPNAVLVSALTGQGIGDLQDRLADTARASGVRVSVCIPYSHSDLVSLFHHRGSVATEIHEAAGTRLEGTLPTALVARYQSYRTDLGR